MNPKGNSEPVKAKANDTRLGSLGLVSATCISQLQGFKSPESGLDNPRCFARIRTSRKLSSVKRELGVILFCSLLSLVWHAICLEDR